jgi:hypothetical protein
MKKILFASIAVFIGACAYDNAEDLYGKPECPPNAVSFSQSVAPLIENNCAIAGCHVNGQQLPTLESYGQIAANAEKIKLRTGNGTMPPASSGRSLSGEEISLISCWVESGAPDN